MKTFRKIPKHIGIIPDGNRRWATSNGLKKDMGYENGVIPGLVLCELMEKYNVKEATFYGFTTANNKRPKYQRDAFTKACVSSVLSVANKDANILVVGKENKIFPKELLPFANKRVKYGKGSINLNFLINYDWKEDVGEKMISKEIPRLDLIIRWGGQKRLSGFLPIQSVYSDFYFVDNYWPNFKEQDFLDALTWYQNCDITLGG